MKASDELRVARHDQEILKLRDDFRYLLEQYDDVSRRLERLMKAIERHPYEDLRTKMYEPLDAEELDGGMLLAAPAHLGCACPFDKRQWNNQTGVCDECGDRFRDLVIGQRSVEAS